MANYFENLEKQHAKLGATMSPHDNSEVRYGMQEIMDAIERQVKNGKLDSEQFRVLKKVGFITDNVFPRKFPELAEKYRQYEETTTTSNTRHRRTAFAA